jgi:hypothetical protein
VNRGCVWRARLEFPTQVELLGSNQTRPVLAHEQGKTCLNEGLGLGNDALMPRHFPLDLAPSSSFLDMSHRLFDNFDILSLICSELASQYAILQEEGPQLVYAHKGHIIPSETTWDISRRSHANYTLFSCSRVAKTFRAASLPFIFRTITLASTVHKVETRLEALRSSALLRRYVR